MCAVSLKTLILVVDSSTGALDLRLIDLLLLAARSRGKDEFLAE